MLWGDEKFGDEEEDYETPVDENGVKYTVQFKINEAGKKVRISRKIVTTKKVHVVNRRVEERKQRWKKFGRVKDVEGIEPGATYRGDEVFLIMGEEGKAEEARREQEEKDKKELEELYVSLVSMDRPKSCGHHSDQSPAPWRPTFTRSCAIVSPEKECVTTLRITNISDETTEDDIREMVRDFGRTTRIHLVMDRETHLSKGLAFVTFSVRIDAENAMKHLNGRGLHHSILNVQWANS